MGIVEFIKKRKNIIIFLLIIVAWAVNVFLSRVIKEPQTEFGPGVDYKGLVPGVSRRPQVLEKMGNLVSETEMDDKDLLKFQSTSPNRDHEAVLAGESLVFIKEIVTATDNKKITELTSRYGESSNVLYGPSSVGGFNLYVYPEKGLAYLGNPTGEGALIEIWYFPPNTLAEFRKQWAPQYSETFSPNTQY